MQNNSPSRRRFLKTGLLTSAVVASSQKNNAAPSALPIASKTAQKPNILWITTDAQRRDTLNIYGNTFSRTPVTTQLAHDGVVFDHAFVQNPLCQPSRGCMLTGRYPKTNGLTKNGQDMNPEEILITRVLAENGYVCGLAGKLHLSACDHRIRDYGPEWWRHKNRNDFFIREPRLNDGYSEFYWDHSPNGNPYSDYTKWVQGKGGKIEYPSRRDCTYVDHGMPTELHQTTYTAEMAIDFIRRHKNEPWLFSLNTFDPHFPFNPPDEFLQRYLNFLDDIPLPNYREGEWDNKPAYQRTFAQKSLRWPYPQMTERDNRMIRAAYWAMCDLIDEQVGRVLQTLQETGQRENTMVIFTSDHGEMLGDHGIYTKGPFMYDPAVRVPLIISWPGHIASGVRSEALVETGDLAPTLLQAVGLERLPGMQTRSLWPLLTGKSDLNHFRDNVYCEYYDSNPNKPPQYRTMVRTQDYKLIATHGETPSQLYDLQNDPGESVNLWNNPHYADIQTELYQQLCDRMAMTVDPLPPRIGIF